MKATKINLNDAYVITTPRHGDERGFFIESFNHRDFSQVVDAEFVQDNHSKSSKGVLRGLHYQIEHAQGKLVRCTHGAVFDAIVDLRKSSSTFGKWFGIKLCENNISLWVPPGFAHGFYTLSDYAEIQYKTTDYYHPEFDRSLMWNDSDIGIIWGNYGDPVLSLMDQSVKSFKECYKYE